MKLLLLLALLFTSTKMTAQSLDITGDWFGIAENLDGNGLTYVFHIKKDNNVYSSAIDVLEIENSEIKPEITTFENGIIKINSSTSGMQFEGKLYDINQQIEGIYSENGTPFRLVLKKGTPKTIDSKSVANAKKTSWFSERSLGISMLISFGTLAAILLGVKM